LIKRSPKPMPKRLEVLKTYKLYIGGKFPRSESGRSLAHKNSKAEQIANYSQASRKDFREAVVAARSAQAAWQDSSAYLKGQILYRSAEILEGRSEQFISELRLMGQSPSAAKKEVSSAIDTLIYYAGWSDKYQQIFSSVNPVNSPHYNFTSPEPCGVIAAIAPQDEGLLGLISVCAPLICGGNSVVALASETMPLCAITLAEVFNSSDLPGGVINILTGKREELLDTMSSHMDINGCFLCSDQKSERKIVQKNAALNIKRVQLHPEQTPQKDPYLIEKFQEMKTTWHPVMQASQLTDNKDIGENNPALYDNCEA